MTDVNVEINIHIQVQRPLTLHRASKVFKPACDASDWHTGGIKDNTSELKPLETLVYSL